ncbi:DUF2399 domain-containing protein [Streptomyces sp. MST-110588]|uniref:DUF2399 domain-containing protein n=1 Tax=Streptomyces sp. MST-110588 TaxID=2833628 RepID=UPI001F5DDD1B|nr:DUF2399 domain-containing protein [Streptomyces sp. MST-110588]
MGGRRRRTRRAHPAPAQPDRRVPWHPWRYTAADYRSAVASAPLAPPLTGTPTTAAWDPDLPTALTELGVRTEEESVLDDLLADLGH